MYYEYPRLLSYKYDEKEEPTIDIENSIRNSLLENNRNIRTTNFEYILYYFCITIIMIIVIICFTYIYINFFA